MASRQIRGGLEVDGLSASIRWLGRVDKAAAKEAKEALRDAAKDIQGAAQARIGSGLGARYPQRTGMIGRSTTNTGAGVKLRASRYPWALGAEFGEIVAHVYGRKVGQSRFKRRTMAPHRPMTSPDMRTNTGGYMIQPAIRARLPHWEKEVPRRLNIIFARNMGKASARGR